jgi:hypothetical protein
MRKLKVAKSGGLVLLSKNFFLFNGGKKKIADCWLLLICKERLTRGLPITIILLVVTICELFPLLNVFFFMKPRIQFVDYFSTDILVNMKY